MIGTSTPLAQIPTLVRYMAQVRLPRPLYLLPVVNFSLQTPKAKTGSETRIQEEVFFTQLCSPRIDYCSLRLP